MISRVGFFNFRTIYPSFGLSDFPDFRTNAETCRQGYYFHL